MGLNEKDVNEIKQTISALRQSGEYQHYASAEAEREADEVGALISRSESREQQAWHLFAPWAPSPPEVVSDTDVEHAVARALRLARERHGVQGRRRPG